MIGPGSRLAHYEIDFALGKGGMGEVWRARDTKLGREVAIKTLPAEFADDADRLARFEREAKLLASLNHPNIAAIYGLEEHEGSRFLVLELVEGDTLADRLQPGAIPVEESLKLALQIAEALEAAHEKGVIHRDLKPANIKVTDDGKVKVLDFGLAKAFAGDLPDVNLSNSPTLSMQATQAGVILGTAAYMSPEQARGKSVDRRTDIWAFGCVLYEMLAGKQAFQAEDVSLTLAEVMKSEPDWLALPRLQPLLTAFFQQCLKKDPRQRLGDIREMRLALDGSLELTAVLSGPPALVSSSRLRRWAIGAVLGAVVAGLVGFIWGRWTSEDTTATALIRRASIVLTNDGQPIEKNLTSGFAVDPAGDFLVFSGIGDAGPQLFMRYLDQEDAVPIPGTEGVVEAPAISPGGQWLAWVAEGQIKRLSLAGGTPDSVRSLDAAPNGIAWLGTDALVFGSPDGLWRIPASGGDPEPLTSVTTAPDDLDHRWPRVSDDGRILAYTVWGGSLNTSQVRVHVLGTGEEQSTPGYSPRFTSTGVLLVGRDTSVWGTRLETDPLRINPNAVPVLDAVAALVPGLLKYDVTMDGTLIFEERNDRAEPLLQTDGAGRVIGEIGQEFAGVHHGPPRLSPDGDFVAVTRHSVGGGDQIAFYDTERGDINLLPGEHSRYPVWTPDGNGLAFGSVRQGTLDIYYTEPGTAMRPEELLIRPGNQTPESWSPNRQVLAFSEGDVGSRDIWILPREGEPSLLIGSPTADEFLPRFSPDGELLAYVSNESGRFEVYVQEYPEGRRIQVSQGSGMTPAWVGNRLYFEALAGTEVFMADVRRSPQLEADPEVAFNTLFRRVSEGTFDVTDGQRFVFLQDEFAASNELEIIVNWFIDLERLVPVQ